METKNIKVENLVLGRFQARKQKLGENLEELSNSIKKWGLLHPLVVCPHETLKGKYEVICGQRRFSCYTTDGHLKGLPGSETIRCSVLNRKLTNEEGLALSGSENWLREDMTSSDTIGTCVLLYRRYGSYKAAAEELAMPVRILRKYVKYDALPPDLKKMVDTNELPPDLANKISQASTVHGEYDEAKSKELVKELKPVDDALRKKFFDTYGRNPDAPVKKVIKAAEKTVLHKVPVSLLKRSFSALGKYAEEQGMTPAAAAGLCVEDSLESKGFLTESDD